MFGPMRGAVVTVYNAQGDGTAAVSAYGTVASTATAAYVYQDRAGATLMPNPVTLDDLGGPIDLVAPQADGVYFSFYGFPGIYHLLVVLPNGQRFGIPFVRVPFEDLSWKYTDIHATYNDTNLSGTAAYRSGPVINGQHGTDLTVVAGTWSVGSPSNNAKHIVIESTAGAANASCWAGEEFFFSAIEEQGAACSLASEYNQSIGIWGRPMMIVGQMGAVPVAASSATMLAGISMGFSYPLTGAAAGEAACPILASPVRGIVTLYQKLSDLSYNLLIAKGNTTSNDNTATASEILTLTGPGATAVDSSAGGGIPGYDRLKILYNPNAKVVEAWVNGWFGGRITTAAKFPSPTDTLAGSLVTGYNVFAQSGSGAGNMQTFFYNCGYWVGLPW